MTRRPTAALVLGLALAGTSPTPGMAQRVPPPVLTITPQQIDFRSDLFGVSFADADHGLAVGAYHRIFRTTDGGTTWSQQTTPLPTREPAPGATEDPSGQAYSAVSFIDPMHAVAVSGDGSVVATADGGTTWELKPTPPPGSVDARWPGDIRPRTWGFNGVSFVDPQHGYVVGHDGLILATEDGGTTWTYQGNPQYGILHDVDFVDRLNGQVVGTASGRPDEIRYTTLGTNHAGETWQATLATKLGDEAVPINMFGIAVTVPMHAVAVGEAGRILVTFDGGKTWRNRRSGTNETLYDVAFADRRRGVAVGGVDFQGDHRAIVLATNDGGESWTAFPEPEFGFFRSVTFGSPTTAYAVGCIDTFNGTDRQTCTAAVVKIDFPEPDGSLLEEPGPSGSSRLPLLLLGGAGLVAATGFLLARRR